MFRSNTRWVAQNCVKFAKLGGGFVIIWGILVWVRYFRGVELKWLVVVVGEEITLSD